MLVSFFYILYYVPSREKKKKIEGPASGERI